MSKPKDLTGMKFGRLTAISPERTSSGAYGWKCVCDCGNITITTSTKLKSGHTQSCGCYRKEMLANNTNGMKHGLTFENGKKARLYQIWSCMRTRCHNKNDGHYPDYGGRGITICDEWKDYQQFHDWAIRNGYKDGLSIDRIDVDGNYEPNNCRWATIFQQNINKRNSIKALYQGNKLPLVIISQLTGIKYQTLIYHHRKGDVNQYIEEKG